MKTNFRYIWWFSIILSLALASCQKDGGDNNEVVIESIWTNTDQTEPVQITSSYTGTYIRISGRGFSGLTAIYCNGVRATFNPTFIRDNAIIFTIPSSVPMEDMVDDPALKSTIRVVSAKGEYVYKGFIFKDKNRMPGITSVSHTMPKAGQYIYIDGKNLSLAEKIFFPSSTGEIEATDFTVVSASRIKVKVPAGVGDKSGAIRLVVLGDNFLSPPYMFYQEGVFISTLTEDYNLPLPSGGASYKLYSDPSEIATTTGLSSNPENIIAIPSAPANLTTVSATGGWNSNNPMFRVFFTKGIDKVIADASNNITGETSLQDIAYQFDLYIPKSFNSGAVAFKVNKDNSPASNGSMVYYYTPYGETPYSFSDGWETVTIKFSDFPGLALGKLSAYRATINNYQSMIGFSNSSVNGKTASLLTDWQIFVANIRLVPLVSPNTTE